VNVLLGVEVAGKPHEELPVAQLIFHFRPAVLAGAVRQRPAQVSLLDALDFPDGAPEDPLHCLAHAQIVAPAKAGDEIQVLLLRLFGRGQHAAHAGGVDGHGLFAKDVFAGSDGGLEVHGAKMRRRGQNYHVHIAVDQLLGGVETHETMVGVNRHFVRKVLRNGDKTVVHAVGKGVGHCHQLAIFVGAQRIHRGAASPAAAADQADLQEVVAGRMGAAGNRQPAGQDPGRRQGGSGLQKIASAGTERPIDSRSLSHRQDPCLGRRM
jgi:hypothetical protein